MYFENYRDCALHGYEYSYKLLEVLDTEVMEKNRFILNLHVKKLKVVDNMATLW